MKETWRWFGPADPIPLAHIAQAGATGIVTSLHDIATGDIWPLERIIERKQTIEAAGLQWSVIESIPLHNDIKTRSGNYAHYINNYQQSLRNLAAAGLTDVCYNFMPVVDWTRTDLNYLLPDGSQALRFDLIDFIAYDVLILQRPNARSSYTTEQLTQAEQRFAVLSAERKQQLESNIIAGLPGGDGSYTRDSILQTIQLFIDLGEDTMRDNLIGFLRDITPVAEELGIRLCIHPDDPPFSLFGLPRVVSTAEDIRRLIAAVPSPANGVTLCVGSYGSRADNDPVAIASEFADRIYFAHLRNVTCEPDGSFYEAAHLGGGTDMVALIQVLLKEEQRRQQSGSAAIEIPFRPDHGHLIAEEIGRTGINSGYSYGGRLKGLAELRGVMHTLERLNAF
jgi:mannonate dehydratase